jgi:hypothetical protein
MLSLSFYPETHLPLPSTAGERRPRTCPKCGWSNPTVTATRSIPHCPSLRQTARVWLLRCNHCWHEWSHRILARQRMPEGKEG